MAPDCGGPLSANSWRDPSRGVPGLKRVPWQRTMRRCGCSCKACDHFVRPTLCAWALAFLRNYGRASTHLWVTARRLPARLGPRGAGQALLPQSDPQTCQPKWPLSTRKVPSAWVTTPNRRATRARRRAGRVGGTSCTLRRGRGAVRRPSPCSQIAASAWVPALRWDTGKTGHAQKSIIQGR